MAKKKPSTVNKSKAIREEFQAHGLQTRPKDIIAALAAKGIDVTAAHVSNVKATLVSGGGARSSRRNGKGEVAIDDLLAAKQLVDRMGGLERAKKAIDALAKLL